MPVETIEGVVEDIVFYNPDNGYTVLSLEPTGKRGESVVVVGKLLELQPGESVRFTGIWTTHREYGDQFKAESMHLTTPKKGNLMSILASGMIDGITDPVAQKIVDFLGPDTMDILDQSPARIYDVPGIKHERAERIETSWTEQRKQRKVLIFLQNYGITAGLAHKIYDTYGDDTITEIQADPYKLAVDVEGVGFKTADQIAQSMGRAFDDPMRVRGGVISTLSMIGSEGHVYLPRPLAIEKTAASLGVEPDAVDVAVTGLLKSKSLRNVKKMPSPSGPVEAVYVAAMYDHETSAAARLKMMLKQPESRLKGVAGIDWDAFFAKLARSKDHVALTEQQQDAVRAALTNKVSILTGGPGTGKTTTLRSVIKALDSIKAKYALASPTGRAARRLAEATGREARTIHRLLGYTVDGDFLQNEDAPLDVDMVIIDETSMVDLELFSHLLAAIPDTAHLMLVGDVDQLPSVGAGDVLRDVINSGIAHVTRLEAIFRQASDSLIVVNAHRVNQGEMPDVANSGSDFFLFSVTDGSQTPADLLVDVVQNRIPRKFGLDPLRDVQVLAPMYKGDVGIHVLNERLQAVLNPPDGGDDFQIGGRMFRIGDKVIQTRNNYEKDVYNGDIGRITHIDPFEQKLELDMDSRVVEYLWKETHDLYHAFAISVHRSQGGEYPAIVLPVVSQHSWMLQRNLLYTAITRARKLVVLVGTRRAIQMAVENDRVTKRYSGLVYHLAKKAKA